MKETIFMRWLCVCLLATWLGGCGEEPSGSGDAPSDIASDVAQEEEAGSDKDIEAKVDVPKVYSCADRTKCTRQFCDQVLLPGGKFQMGSQLGPNPEAHFPAGDARPVHSVTVTPFCMDKYEVTLERYEDCVDSGHCAPLGLKFVEKADTIETVINHYPKYCYSNLDGCKYRAVNAKNYFQAQHYCQWMGSRLCTEAEWEFAARGGPGDESRSHPWGNQTPNASLVNIPSVGTGYVEAVNKYGAGKSVHGIYNLAGNVYEWVRDAYHPYEHTAAGETLVDPVYLPKTSDVQVIARGSCFFTEPQQTVTERSKMHMTFDWG
jgi:eukaryotic-like serine/threonine-protein kinase